MELLNLSPLAISLILLAGFATAVLHGATGMAGGIVMTAILSVFIGVKSAIPAMTVALIISHSSRAILNIQSADFALAARVLLFAVPGIAAGAILFSSLEESLVALVMAVFLIASFPIKRYSKNRETSINNRTLALGSGLWGFLAGNVVGPGFVLAPFLLTTGMNRHTFVATLACIVLVMNVVKSGVFVGTELLNSDLMILGVLIGLATIPGNWAGRAVLHAMSDADHSRAVDLMTWMLILYFFSRIFWPQALFAA